MPRVVNLVFEIKVDIHTLKKKPENKEFLNTPVATSVLGKRFVSLKLSELATVTTATPSS